MIIVIDNKTNLAYYSNFSNHIAEFIGVHPNTIYNWKKEKENTSNKIEEYRNYTIYFDSDKV